MVDLPRLQWPAAVKFDRQGVQDETLEATPTIKLDCAMLDAFIERGQSLLKSGNIVSARLVFEKAYEGGDPRGARFMAMSYDPAHFAKFPVAGLVPNLDLAELWYERANVVPPIEHAGARLVAQQCPKAALTGFGSRN